MLFRLARAVTGTNHRPKTGAQMLQLEKRFAQVGGADVFELVARGLSREPLSLDLLTDSSEDALCNFNACVAAAISVAGHILLNSQYLLEQSGKKAFSRCGNERLGLGHPATRTDERFVRQ